MKKQIYKRWYDELYSASIHIIINGSVADANAIIEKETGLKPTLNSSADMITEGFVWDTPEDLVSTEIPGFYFYWNGEAGSTLLHELFHLATTILKSRGLEPEEIIGEAGAYYLAYLYREIDLIWRPVKKKKK